MKKKIRAGAVNYLNTKPLIYGFSKGYMKDEIELVLDYPSRIAQMLLKDEIDIGLVPVVIIPELNESYIISEYCIGCDGEVASVVLFSDVPLQKIEKILLDYQSKTSIELLKILMKNFWKIAPLLIETTNDFSRQITGSTAGLLIGDRALEERHHFKFTYDLGQEWKNFTGLPFVFAVWVANKKLEEDFIERFTAANNIGLEQLNEVINQENLYSFDLQKYYTEYISYELNEEKEKAMAIFLAEIEKAPEFFYTVK